MKNQQFVFVPFSGAEGKKQNNLREVISKCSYHWPLFLVSMIIMIALALFYMKVAKPVYHVKAKLSIKDEKKSTAEKVALDELNISTTPKLVESEIEILKSRPIVKEVVDKLQLWVNYAEPFHYSANDLYSRSPVRFKFLKAAREIPESTFDILVKSRDRFILYERDKEPLSVSFKSTLSNNMGTWRLDTTGTINEYIGKRIRVSVTDPYKTISVYQSRIATTLNKDAPIVELKIDDEVPERGKEILDHLISAYKASNIIDKNKETESTLRFIDERLASLTGELTDVEKNVEGYKSSIGLTDISSQSKFYLDNVQSNDSRLNEVNVQLNVIEGIERYVNTAEKAENIPATLGITDPGLINLVDQLTKFQLQRDKLLAITPESNPIFVPLNRQINSTKAAIKENVRGIKSSLLTTKRQLQRINSNFESSIKGLPGQERQYVSIKRQQGIKENLYIYLLQQREQVALSYASTLTDARTVEEAHYEEPQSKKTYALSFALLFGFMLPVGLIYGRDMLRNRILTRSEIEATISVPIISELIQEDNTSPIVVTSDRSAYAIGEQIRALRTNLLHFYQKKERGKVTLFTSSISGEGKSFVASNIGVSLAVSGRKTIILELDLRKPKITRTFNLDTSNPGLTNLLNGEVSKEEAIQPSDVHPNLDIMSSGPIPSNPSELLEGRELEQLIEELRFEYDNILIDSPPLRLVTDAMILARLSDVTLYLIRQGHTSKEELKFIEQMKEENKLPNLNVVFNGINKGKYGYGYNYDYSYYSQKDSRSIAFYIRDFLKRF